MNKPDYPQDLKTPVLLMVCPFISAFNNNVKNNVLMKNNVQIDYNKAFGEWLDLYNFIASRSIVYLLPNEDYLQDQIFSANLGVVIHNQKEPTVVMSNFTSEPRQGEEEVGIKFFSMMKYHTYRCPYKFEGEADLKYIRDNIWIGGYGIRSDIRSYKWIAEQFNCHIVPVQMYDKKCYDEETEILTNNGWKYFKDLDKTELIASINEFGDFEYQKPTAYQSYKYSGEMFEIKSKHVDLLVTPDHNIFYSTEARSWYGFKEIKYLENISRMHFLHGCSDFKGEYIDLFILDGVEPTYAKCGKNYSVISKYNKKYKEPIKFSVDNWCEFMGWYLSEGYINQHKNKKGNYSSYQIGICQLKNKDYINEIHNLLNNMNIKYHYDGRVFNFSDKRVWLYLKQFGKSDSKFIPQWMKDLPKKQLSILFNSLMKGDSNIRKYNIKKEWKNSGYTYYTKSKKFADDVQEISIKLGYRASVKLIIRKSGLPYYVVYINNRLFNSNILKQNINKIYVNDINVYDVTIPKYHTLIVRRNGKSCVSGNCYHFDCCMFPLDEHNALVNTSILDHDNIDRINSYVNIIDVPKEFSHAGITNLCRLGSTILCRDLEPAGKKWLTKVCSDYGFDVKYFPLNSYDANGADLSCLILHMNKPFLPVGKSVVSGIRRFFNDSRGA